MTTTTTTGQRALAEAGMPAVPTTGSESDAGGLPRAAAYEEKDHQPQ